MCILGFRCLGFNPDFGEQLLGGSWAGRAGGISRAIIATQNAERILKKESCFLFF